MSDWTRADRWRTELARTAGAVPVDSVIEFGLALLGELTKRGTPHGALSPEAISVRREGSALRVRIDTAPTDPKQETLLATGSRSMSAHPGVHYRANEQFVSDWFDARADCFAVGVMLYELAAGQLPFGQEHTGSFQVFLKLKRGGFPSVRELRPEVSEALATVIVRALALRPEERFDGVAAMATALRTLVRAPTASPPLARPAPDRSGVPLDPLRPIETGVLPVATQAAIAAYRAGDAKVAERSAPVPTPSRPVPRAEPPAPPSTPVTRPPIVMAPPRTAPRLGPQTDPFEARPPRTERTQVTGPPPEMERKPVPAAVATRPVEPLHIAPAAPSRIPEPLRTEPALPPAPRQTKPLTEAGPAPTPAAPRTLPPPAPPPRRAAPIVAPVTPRATSPSVPSISLTPRMTQTSETPTAVARTPTAPLASPPATVAPPPAPAPRVETRANATVVAPAPLQEELLARSTQLVEPDLAALQRMTAPSPPTPVPAPPRAEPAAIRMEDDRPVPPVEDTARRSTGEITPPNGNETDPPKEPTRGRDAVIIGSVLLLLGLGAGLLVRLPSRAVKQAAATECVPGPEKICPPPPEPVALPEPTPPAPVQCVPPKPSPRLTCFYDGLRDGQARYLRGDRRGALEAFQAAEHCMPRNPALLKWIGRCHEDLRDRDEARTYYDRYLRRRPRADDADFYRGKVEALTRAPDGGTR